MNIYVAHVSSTPILLLSMGPIIIHVFRETQKNLKNVIWFIRLEIGVHFRTCLKLGPNFKQKHTSDISPATFVLVTRVLTRHSCQNTLVFFWTHVHFQKICDKRKQHSCFARVIGDSPCVPTYAHCYTCSLRNWTILKNDRWFLFSAWNWGNF